LEATKRDPIAVVMDERVPREKLKLLTRVINDLRRFAMVQVFEGGISEDELLQKLKEKPYKMVLVPWYRYIAWNKIESFYGLTRSSGPAFAGYFAENILPYELGETLDRPRSILLDFSGIHAHEAVALTKALLYENRRTGIRPLLKPDTPIFCESWFSGQSLGPRLDSVFSLPSIANSEWLQRSSSLRICLMALWSLIYEEGPGKTAGKTARAYFQFAAEPSVLLMRLCWNMPGLTSKDLVAKFWPDSKKPNAPTQLLLKHSDLLRLNSITEGSDIELTIAFFPSAAAEQIHQSAHTFWIEPITSSLISELAYEQPGPASPHLHPIPTQAPQTAAPAQTNPNKNSQERFMFHAATKIRELKKLLTEREDQIRELRAGGIGTAPPLPPPDAEGLLEAFQYRYSEAQDQIQELEQVIVKLEQTGGTPQEIEAVRNKINAMTTRERGWIRKLAETIEAFKRARMREKTG
jgi:hypothetical protein